jgi:hypothetical protein
MDLGSTWIGLPFLASVLILALMTVVTCLISVKHTDVGYVGLPTDEEDLEGEEETGRTTALGQEAASRNVL